MNKSFQSLYINNGKRRPVPCVLYILIAFMGAVGTVFSFVSCFHFGMKGLFYLFWIALTLGVCSLYLIDWFREKLLILFLLGSMLYVLFCFDGFLTSAVQVCNIAIQDINDAYHMGLKIIILPERFALDVGPEAALAMLTVLVTFLTAYFVLGRSSVVGCLCVSMPLSIFGIFFDIFPRLEFLLLVVTFWIAAVVIHASGKRGTRVADGAAYNAVFAAAGVWLVYLFGQAVLPEQKYVRVNFMENAKIYIEKNVEILSHHYSKSRGGIGNGTFGDQNEVYFTGETVLEVKIPPFSRNIYLRTAEYNEYLGNVWEYNDTYFRNYFGGSFEELGTEQQPQNFTASILKNLEKELDFYGVDMEQYEEMVTKYQVRVRNFTFSAIPFAPYGAEFNAGRMNADVMPESNRASVSTYTVYMAADLRRFCELFPPERFLSQWNAISAQMPTLQDTVYYQTLEAEEEYAAFVRKAYTQVPDEMKNVVGRYVPQAVEYDYGSEMAFADEIRRMFIENFEYTLAPGRVPEGIDGVEYFLNESRKGYCVYFASAATLIFRQAGIPARYVEGFVITPDMMQNVGEDGYADVTVIDSKAHAWPEIYIAGYGWVPIEVTPGFYNEMFDRGPVEAQISIEELLKEGEDDDEDTGEDENPGGADKEEQDEEEDVSDTGLIGVLAAVILALAGLLGGGYVLSGRGERKKAAALFDGGEGTDGSERVLLAWWYIEKLLLFKSVKIPDSLTVSELKEFLKEHFVCFSNGDWNDRIDTIMEVYFGKKIPDEEETDRVVEMAGAFGSEIYKDLKWTGKLRFRVVHGL
ncbi:MAG: transglutaminase-like domain-containing protein [Alistipes sp.]|nr:transglutaminase-like domain-containing protein [Alistipes sp.]